MVVESVSEESFDDFPECYKTMIFDEWLEPISEQNGKRPKFSGRGYWPLIETNLPFVNTWQVQEHKRRLEKQPANLRADATQGLIPKKPSYRGSESRTVVTQFFRFAGMTQRIPFDQFRPSQDHLLSKITVEAFLNFYGQHVGSPNTSGNVAKILSGLYQYMQVSCS